MKTTLSLSVAALALFATALAAQAADRQIAVQPKQKFQSITVQDQADEPTTLDAAQGKPSKIQSITVEDSEDVAAADDEPAPVKTTPKAVRVDDTTVADDEETPAPPRKKLRVRIEEPSQQALTPPAVDHSADIAADTDDTNEAVEDNNPNELRYYKLKKRHHKQMAYQSEQQYSTPSYTDEEPSYTYQQPTYSYRVRSYAGPSCHNSNAYGY